MFPIGSIARPAALASLLTLLAGAAACSPAPAAQPDPAAQAAAADSATMARGLALVQAGDHAGAIAAFREVLVERTTHYGARYQLARALDLAGRPVEAREEWTTFLPMAEAAGDAASLGTVRSRLAQADSLTESEMMLRGLELLYSRNRLPDAVEQFSRLLERNPKHYGAHFQIATALDRMAQPAEARKWWVKFEPMATAAKDSASLATVQARLAQNP